MTLAGEQLKAALIAIAAWRVEPEASVNCPVCGSPHLSIYDRSTRPYAEWWQLVCESCGLDTTVHIPMSGPPET